ncbi:MAG: SulP family inorganic anion transporter [Pirellulales bacterium]
MATSPTPHEPPQSAASSWRQDLLASIVVFLVAVPLCMGIALASGVPVAAGLITGIVGGLLVGTFAGSPLQVSGPAAGLTIVCGEVIRQHGLSAFGIIVMIAGAIQLLAGLARLGKWFRAVSPAVIHGMLSGIGLLILTGQLHVMIDDRPRENGLANLQAIPVSLWRGLGLPSWESSAARQDQTASLRAWNALYDEQRSLARLVSRSLAKAKALAPDSATPAAVDWHGLSQQQRRLADRTIAAADSLKKSPLSQLTPASGRSWNELLDGTTKLQAELAAALASESLENSEQLATKVVPAVAGVLTDLKAPAWAGKLGLLAIAIIVFWPKVATGRLKLVPAALVAVVATTALAWSLDLPVLRVNVPANLLDGINLPSVDAFGELSLKSAFVSGLMIAVIASAETLLCAAAVDQMHSGPRTRYDRELAAQGIGNLVTGFLGALPMTGVIVRSAANVQAGGKTRLSAILHGAWLLLFAAFLAPILNQIPVAALAGVLVVTGFKLIDFRGLAHLWKSRRVEALIFLATIIVIVAEDLLLGVVTGMVLSAIRLLFMFSHLEVTVDNQAAKQKPGDVDAPRDRVVLRLAGAATFLKLPILAETLDRVPAGVELHADLEHLDFIDHACLELLATWAKRHEGTGGRLVLDWGQLHARLDTSRARRDPAEAT